MCTSDPNWADVLTAVGTAILALTGVYATFTWRRNIRGATKHETATKVLEEARLFRYLFYDARSPLYLASEFPPWYHALKDPSDTQISMAYACVYQNRWQPLSDQMIVLAKLRARAGALLGEQVATAIESLARKGRELHRFMEDRVDQYRDGELVKQRPDQDWIAHVKASVTAAADPKARDDRYSKEFDAEFSKLEQLVQPFV